MTYFDSIYILLIFQRHRPKIESVRQVYKNEMLVAKHSSMPLESNKSMKSTVSILIFLLKNQKKPCNKTKISDFLSLEFLLLMLFIDLRLWF